MLGTVPIQIRPIPGGQASLLVERSLGAELRRRIPAGKLLTLRLGGREVRLPWRVVGRKQTLRGLRIAPEAAEELGLPISTTLHARWADGGLRLGPVVGIFALRSSRPSNKAPFGSETAFFEALCFRGRGMGQLVVVFSPEDIDWERRTVHGYGLRPDGGWYRAHFALPHVAYDRVQRRGAEREPELRDVKERLVRECGVTLFPPGFLDKWEVYTLLKDAPKLGAELPETRLLRGPESLRSAIEAWNLVYLKPTRGSLGAGIFVADRQADGRYRLRFRKAGRTRAVRTLTVRGLWRILRQERRQGVPYIAQQGLDLTTVKRRRFDVRALMQKDAQGVWQRTKLFARVAEPGRITANISTGAEGVPIESVLRPLFGNRTGRYVRQVKQAALRVAMTLEERLGAPVGELGVDLGVDRSGRVWLIEVNSKPHRKLDGGSKVRARLSIERPLEYAQHLAGFVGPMSRRRRR